MAESKAVKSLLHLLVHGLNSAANAPNSAARRGLDVESGPGAAWSIPVPQALGPGKQSARAASRSPGQQLFNAPHLI